MRTLLPILLVLLLATPSFPITLKECVVAALKNNPKVMAQSENLKASGAEVELVVSEFFPKVWWELDYTRSGGSNIPPGDLYSHSLTAQWEVFSGLSTYNDYLARRLLKSAEKSALRRVMLDVSLEVVKAYTDALSARYQLEAARHYLKSAEYGLKLAEGRFKVGLAPRADVLHARSKVAEARFKVVEKKRDYLTATGRLAVAMGLPADTPLDVEGLEPKLADFSFKELLKVAQEMSPEVKEAKLRWKAQSKKVSSVKGEFMPTVSLFSSYSQQDESLFPDDRDTWSFGFKVKIPLFTGFSTWKKLKAEKAKLQLNAYRLREAILELQERVWSAYQNYKEAKEKLIWAKRYWEAAKEDLRIMRKKYQVGLASIVDLTTSQASAYEAESSYYTAYTQLIYAYYSLVRAVGKIPTLEEL